MKETMRLTRVVCFFIVFCLISSLTFFAAAKQTEAQTPQSGGILKMVQTSEPFSLGYPATMTGQTDGQVSSLALETLFRFDEQGNELREPRYHVRVFQQQEKTLVDKKSPAVFQMTKDVYPQYSNGAPLNFIPFVIVNPSGLGVTIEEPPLLDLVAVNLSHYKTSADLEWATYYVAFPQIAILAKPQTKI